MSGDYKHWNIEIDADRIVWLGMDVEGSSVNVLSSTVMEELRLVIGEIEKSPPAGLILHSLKENGFIAGADVKEFTQVKDEMEAFEKIRKAQSLFDHIENLAFPTVAMIHGFCLGGGLELALSFDHRVASSHKSTRLGFPEVLLGIHPGFGGSVRSTRIMGGLEAMTMMLTGRTMDGSRAKKLGLVDHCVPLRNLKTAALATVKGAPGRIKAPLLGRLSNLPGLRALVAVKLEKETAKKVLKKHYPAPYALIDLWRDQYGDQRKMMVGEARSVAKLVVSPTAQNLIRVFMLQERLKSSGDGEKFNPARVHVIGAGAMGGDIAAWLALRGYKVTLQDTETGRVAPVIKRAHALFIKKLRNPRLISAAMDRLAPDVAGMGVGAADIVIEAIFENLEAKRNLYSRIEPAMKQDAILATNTSSIMLEKLAEGLARPELFVGLHFFNPVAMMKLVEVVKGPATSPQVATMAASFVRAMDKLPLIVNSAPGFLINRILTPYLYEAMKLASEGVPISVIDKAAVDFGMPMGPVTLADAVGLDICLSVINILGADFAMEEPADLARMVGAGKLGKKSGSGFYQYKDGKQILPIIPAGYSPPADLTDRLTLRMVNQSVECLRQGIVEDADLLDGGVIFGTGFAPFRGGPINYSAGRGHVDVVETLRQLAEKHGPRFDPDQGWDAIISDKQ
ncbi:MAG: 3-hydroxyacyl-CoA dehydrogenase NAD-binding domain-containing protein [Nitrospinota bacterium]|nr:3-hydroxyacyl-CoA dehydrogenase NAD-binding domain-containing protein [Nitrospinota bacterium]